MSLKTKFYVLLASLITFIVCLAIGGISKALHDPQPKKLGSFEVEGTRTEVIQAGDCQVFVSKWANQPEPRFFFSCPTNK